MTVTERFASEEAHRLHCETPWFRDCWARLHDFCIEGRFENIYPGRVVADSADFTAPH